MNIEWVTGRLDRYEDLAASRRAAYKGSGYSYTDQVRELDYALRTDMPTIRQILKAIDPPLAADIQDPGYDGNLEKAVAAIRQARGILRDRDEWQANLQPDAPALAADQFHPRIWGAAAVIWDTGQYHAAISQAASALSALIAARARSHLTDRELVNEVLAPTEPAPGKTRLHLPGDKRSREWKARQEGLHHLAQGAFAGIRNPAAHDTSPWPEHYALEQLAVLSLIARWADETELVSGAPR